MEIGLDEDWMTRLFGNPTVACMQLFQPTSRDISETKRNRRAGNNGVGDDPGPLPNEPEDLP